MEIPVCNRRCIDLQKKVRRPEGIALPFSTFRVAQRIGAISNKQIFFLLLCHSFYVPFQEDICYSEHIRGISGYLFEILHFAYAPFRMTSYRKGCNIWGEILRYSASQNDKQMSFRAHARNLSSFLDRDSSSLRSSE